jgi:hypothetical protein
MSKNKKDKKESSMFDIIGGMTGIQSKFVNFAIVFISIIVFIVVLLVAECAMKDNDPHHWCNYI